MRFAPLADAIAGGAVDGPVGPLRGRGREGFGVDVAKNFADGEIDETFSVATIDLKLALVEIGRVVSSASR